MATHLLVGNPTAQSGQNQQRIDRALKLLRARGVAVDFLATEPEGRTIATTCRTLDGQPAYRVVMAMGGDGTFREVGAALLACQRREEVAMGMLPTGTANDQGRSFGLDAGDAALERNVDVVVAAHETRLDAGILEQLAADGAVLGKHAFFDSAGWGISARVLATRNMDRELAKRTGLDLVYRDKLVYAGAALQVFLESYVVDDKFAVQVTHDGRQQRIEGLTELIVKGTRVYAGGWVFDRTSRHDDGLFEVVPFRGKRDWTSKAIVDLDGNPITDDMLENIGVTHSRPFRATHIELAFEGKPPAAQLDGEEAASSPRVRIEVQARALRLIVPAPEA